jgi:hypothetical protein
MIRQVGGTVMVILVEVVVHLRSTRPSSSSTQRIQNHYPESN